MRAMHAAVAPRQRPCTAHEFTGCASRGRHTEACLPGAGQPARAPVVRYNSGRIRAQGLSGGTSGSGRDVPGPARSGACKGTKHRPPRRPHAPPAQLGAPQDSADARPLRIVTRGGARGAPEGASSPACLQLPKQAVRRRRCLLTRPACRRSRVIRLSLQRPPVARAPARSKPRSIQY